MNLIVLFILVSLATIGVMAISFIFMLYLLSIEEAKRWEAKRIAKTPIKRHYATNNGGKYS